MDVQKIIATIDSIKSAKLKGYIDMHFLGDLLKDTNPHKSLIRSFCLEKTRRVILKDSEVQQLVQDDYYTLVQRAKKSKKSRFKFVIQEKNNVHRLSLEEFKSRCVGCCITFNVLNMKFLCTEENYKILYSLFDIFSIDTGRVSSSLIFRICSTLYPLTTYNLHKSAANKLLSTAPYEYKNYLILGAPSISLNAYSDFYKPLIEAAINSRLI